MRGFTLIIMQYKTLLILFLILGILFFFNQGNILAYDDKTTHPALTQEIVEFYNLSFPDKKLTDQQKEWIIEGSILEDTPSRWMNHFYDPQTGKGLWNFSSAKEWSKENIKQSLYPRGNQTWQKAISLYAEGKKQEAFIALGHILHLIEDMAVPAHTRLDAHPEGDPYESWVKQNFERYFNPIGITKLNNLDKFFDLLASYSNKYFLSKDSINEYNIEKGNFSEKIINKKIYLISYDDQGEEYKLIEKKLIPGEIIYNLDSPVHSDYYSLLAPNAISYGAGVIVD